MQYKKLTIPERFKSVNYEEDVLQSIKDLVENFEKSRKGIFLHGNAGTGKTHTGYAICKELEKRGMKVMAFKALDILKMIKDDMKYQNIDDYETNGIKYFDEMDFLNGLNSFKGILFIDDFGTEKASEWVSETFYSIIDKRYEEMLPTIITSNWNLSTINKEMGDRMASRIAQMCDIIPMVGTDRRLN